MSSSRQLKESLLIDDLQQFHCPGGFELVTRITRARGHVFVESAIMPAGVVRRGVRIRHDAARDVFEVTLEFHNEGRKETEPGVSHCTAVVIMRSEAIQGKTMMEIFEEAFAHFDSVKRLL